MRPDATAPDSGMRVTALGAAEGILLLTACHRAAREALKAAHDRIVLLLPLLEVETVLPQKQEFHKNSTVETPEAAMPEDRRAAPPAEPMETPETGMPQEQPPAVPEEGMPQEGAADTPDAAMPEEQAAPDTGMPPETEPDTEHKNAQH